MTVAGGSVSPATSATAAACTLMLSVRAPGRAPSDSMATIRAMISRRSASNSVMRARADLAAAGSDFLNANAMVTFSLRIALHAVVDETLVMVMRHLVFQKQRMS